MRISDWSSDVCSSDLAEDERCHHGEHEKEWEAAAGEVDQQPRNAQPKACQHQHADDDAGAGTGNRHIERPHGATAQRIDQNRKTLTNECQRSEEHTSELQSLMRISYAVFCLKKKKKKIYNDSTQTHTETRSRTPNSIPEYTTAHNTHKHTD